MRALRLAALLLASAAACTVETNSLKPKTDDECSAATPGTKACGYKCVDVSDPATGCAAPGVCTPCDGADPAHHVVAICVSGACERVCDYGFGNCNGSGTDGCETYIFGSDPFNCGACGRACTTCMNGACVGTDSGATFSSPRGLLAEANTIYVADAGSVRAYTGTATLTNVATGLGTTRWLAPVPGTPNMLLATGTTATGTLLTGESCSAATDGHCFTITEITALDTATPGKNEIRVTTPAKVGDYFEGLAAAGASIEYFFTYAGSDQVWSWDVNSTVPKHLYYTMVTSPVAPRGLVSYAGNVYFGSNVNGGEAWWTRPTGTGWTPGEVTAGAGRPTRLAVFAAPTFFANRPFLFWISGDDGSVHATLADGTGGVATLVQPISGHLADVNVDMTADAEGVYWVDGGTGRVAMWRAADDRVVPVAFSTSPFSIAVSGGWIYWTDASTNKLYYAEKPAIAVP